MAQGSWGFITTLVNPFKWDFYFLKGDLLRKEFEMVEAGQADVNQETFQRIRVIVAGNQPSTRRGLIKLLDLQPDMRVLGEVQTEREADNLIRKYHPEMLLMIVRMPIMEGIETSQAISERHKKIKIILLFTMDEFFPEGLQLGVIGYPLQEPTANQIVEAIRSTIQEKHPGKYKDWIGTGEEADKCSDQEQRLAAANAYLSKPLTIYEFEILKLICEGMSNHEIALAQSFSVGTVRNNLTNIYKKLGVSNRTEAVFKGRRIGIC